MDGLTAAIPSLDGLAGVILESCKIWGFGEVNQVCLAAAVGCAEAGNGYRRMGAGRQRRRPFMLVNRLADEIPYLTSWRSPPQVVYVPVGFYHRGKVVFESAAQSAGAEGAANIGIPPGKESEYASLTDGEVGGFVQAQNKYVRPFADG